MASFIEVRLEEIASRVRRIETRQMKVALAQGFDPTLDKARAVMVPSKNGGGFPTVEITGLDVSLGDLADACKTSGISGSVRIVHNGVYVGSFNSKE